MHFSSPAHQAFPAIEAAAQLALGLHDLALQDRILDDVLAVLGPDAGQPHTLRGADVVVVCLRLRLRVPSVPLAAPVLAHDGRLLLLLLLPDLLDLHVLARPQFAPCHGVEPERVGTAVHHHVGRVLVPAHVVDEVHPHAARSLVVEIAVQAQGSQVPLQLLPQYGRALSAAGVARLVGAEEDQGAVWGGAGEQLLRGGEAGQGERSRERDGSERRLGGRRVVDVLGYEKRDGGWGDVFDDDEGGEEDDGRRLGVV